MAEADGFMPVDKRCVDDLGRVVLPRTLRQKYNIQEGDEVVFLDNGRHIGIERAQASCAVCHSLENLAPIEGSGQAICSECLRRIKQLSF